MSTSTLSRRNFLRLGGAAALSLAFRDFPPGKSELAQDLAQDLAFPLGRTARSMNYYDQPTTAGRELGFYNTDAVVEILERREGGLDQPHNPLWLRTPEGWIHSAFVQPVENRLNLPVLEVPPGGFLAEVTVPYTQAWKVVDGRMKRAYRFYYGSTYWVHVAYVDQAGNPWYRVPDDLYQEFSYLVLAQDLRRVAEEELAPLSPGVADKLIEVDLTGQRLAAFEDGRPVFTARIASGDLGTGTPYGEFLVERKQPSRHMASRSDASPYDLPGVPWVCFIAWTGVSLHGTYWHNNYGRPQSHGCINLTPQDAKWIYRWTLPVVPPDDNYVESEAGTRVLVV